MARLVSGVNPGEQNKVAGLFPVQWLALVQASHTITSFGIFQMSWPNGRSLLEQSAKLVIIFDVVKAEILAEKKRGSG